MKPKAFVMMPFASEFDDVYEYIICAPLRDAGFDAKRADNSLGSRNIMHDVIDGISSATLVIADLTGANPNVFYELGIAHTMQKPVLLITQDIEDVPFDLRAYRIIHYSTHFAKFYEAVDAIRGAAFAVQNGSATFGSPVSDYHAMLHASASIPRAVPPPARTDRNQWMAAIAEIATDMTQAVEEIAEEMEAIGDKLEQYSPRVDAVITNLKRSQQHQTEFRDAMKNLSAYTDEYAAALSVSNGIYRDGLKKLSMGLDAVFRLDSTAAADAGELLAKTVSIFSFAEGPTRNIREAMLMLVKTLDALPDLEKDFSRARKRLAEETRALVGNMDAHLAISERARRFAGGMQ